ncbi:probable disease resistance protein RPP1 isoform X4 [Arachis ipaensis]|uniref:probable disease resistance protein RPP1 isoform X4 n=1 Tax=Arachis ipaensis TaxID=130454 RepID=UPI0007AF5122|nr:probable disease resistance protein RPP1 isoform X4 [Arachis ipaensis]XP_016189275.1 probable disease resistance protein RPP1 isoform X4 [Arachis ipaensis]XP_025644612.1 probable disease resistance protein RPP1 isoform X3 [Arachis hypogaea]XP_025644613.1 probable disease resistance protein RPP1 isoform X3 [Arachis hypogaea]
MRRQKLCEGVQNLVNLNLVDLNYLSHLVELLGFSKAPNLEEVNVSNCKRLQQVPLSVLSSQRLSYLFLNDCNELRSFQHNIHYQSLKTFSFYSCIGLREFSLTQLNHSTDKLVLSAPLERLKLNYCSNLSLLPENISILSSLKDLSMCHSSVRSLPESIKHLSRLKYLNLSNCERLQSIPELPSSILGLRMYVGTQSWVARI